MGREVELKLALPRTALARLRRHPVMVASTRLASATLNNTYYDTDELVLKKRGIGLRTRNYRKTWLQTVKCAAPSAGGMTQRPEWEQPYTGAFDFTDIDDSHTRKHLLRHQPNLTPIFSTHFKRETRRYTPDEHVSILLMLDTGEVTCGELREPMCELELELERGTPLDLLKLASLLAADLPLLPCNTSKAERGYRLHEGGALPSPPPRPLHLTKSHSPIDAFRILALDCIVQWQKCVEVSVSDTTPGVIHQLRIAQRRLRALIKAFGPALPDTFAHTWNTRLGCNAGQFGAARDLDVVCGDMIAPVAGTRADEVAALSHLEAIANHAWQAAHRKAGKALEPAAQARLILELMVALYSLPVPPPGQPVDLRVFAHQRVTQLRRTALSRFRRARDLAPDHLHDLRIAIKHLRYAIEFFAPLQHKRTAQRAARSLAKVQRQLGYVCDVDMTYRTLATLVGDDMQLHFAAAFVRGWHARQRKRVSHKVLRRGEALLRGDALKQL